MPPNPSSNTHGFAMRSMSLRDMQSSKSEKKNSCPPLPNPGDAPEYTLSIYKLLRIIIFTVKFTEHNGDYVLVYKFSSNVNRILNVNCIFYSLSTVVAWQQEPMFLGLAPLQKNLRTPMLDMLSFNHKSIICIYVLLFFL